MSITKIDAITLRNNQPRNIASRTRTRNLTSFGQGQPQEEAVETKNATEAIKNNFLANVSFKGHVKNVVEGYVGTAGAIAITNRDANSFSKCTYYNYGSPDLSKEYFSPEKDKNTQVYYTDYYYGTAGQIERRALQLESVIKSNRDYYPNSSYESTIRDHNYITDRIYFADPEEKINAQTKLDHDVIVYDNQPHYPTLEAVKENYFNTEKSAVNYGEHYKTLAEYYYRLRKADIKELNKLSAEQANIQSKYQKSLDYSEMLDETLKTIPWDFEDISKDKEIADYYRSENEKQLNEINQKVGYYKDRVEHSKIQIDNAVEAFNIFEEVAPKLDYRDSVYTKISYLKGEITYSTEIVETESEKLKELQAKEISYTKQIALASEWKKEADKTYAQQVKTFGESADAESNPKSPKAIIKRLEVTIQNLRSDLEKIKGQILIAESRVQTHKANIEEAKTKLPELEKEYKRESEDIKALYYKIENFYNEKIEDWQY